MDFTIPYELRALTASLQKFIAKEVKPLEESYRTAEGFIPEEVRRHVRRRSREVGFYAGDFPEEFGGGGLSNLGMSLLREEIGRSGVELADSILGESGAMSHILLECNDEQRDKYLLPAIRADKLSCFALTEPNAGSDAASIETRAVREGSDYVINGRKHFISNAPYADFAIVFAVTDKANRGITCFLVDKRTPASLWAGCTNTWAETTGSASWSLKVAGFRRPTFSVQWDRGFFWRSSELEKDACDWPLFSLVWQTGAAAWPLIIPSSGSSSGNRLHEIRPSNGCL